MSVVFIIYKHYNSKQRKQVYYERREERERRRSLRKFYKGVVKHANMMLALFIVAVVLSAIAWPQVAVNYDINDYLPEDTPSTVALDTMQAEFSGGIPNARVMLRDVSMAQALEYKDRLRGVDGVSDVTWLDDACDITQPLAMMDNKLLDTYYKDGAALMNLTIDEEKTVQAVMAVRELIGDGNAMTGSAVSTAEATVRTVDEVNRIAMFAVLFVIFVLTLTTTSWFEPVIVMLGLGVAILINSGTNLIFGEISFVTNAAGSILQLAVSLDYSVFLLHRFEECRREIGDPREAMIDALCKSTGSILSSGLTTVIGFVALTLMRFRIGPDLGLALAKGVVISLITVFLFVPALTLKTYRMLDRTTHRRLLPSFKRFGQFVCRIMIPMACVFALLIVPSYIASNSNSFYYGAAHIFGPETQLGADTEAVEEVFGKSDTYVLMVPVGDMAKQQQLSDELKSLEPVTSIISYVDNAGAEIPPEYVARDTVEKLMSKKYSRMVISLDTDLEGDATFALVTRMREIAHEYYGDDYHLAGEGVSTYDLMTTVTSDMNMVNLIAIGAVFLVLLATMRTLLLPALLVLGIETAIWINLSIPYLTGAPLFYIAYLIISSVQLGATVDYAILMTDRYREFRRTMNKKDSIVETVSTSTLSILTSASALTVVGFLMGMMSTHGLLSQLGYLLGRGTLCSLAVVMLALPGLLYVFDRLIVSPKKRFDPAKAIENAVHAIEGEGSSEKPEGNDAAQPAGDGAQGDSHPKKDAAAQNAAGAQ